MSRHGGGRRRRLRAPVGGDHERHRGRSARAYRARRRGRHEALQGRLQDHRGGGAVRRQGALRIPRPPADDRPAALRHEANHRQPQPRGRRRQDVHGRPPEHCDRNRSSHRPQPGHPRGLGDPRRRGPRDDGGHDQGGRRLRPGLAARQARGRLDATKQVQGRRRHDGRRRQRRARVVVGAGRHRRRRRDGRRQGRRRHHPDHARSVGHLRRARREPQDLRAAQVVHPVPLRGDVPHRHLPHDLVVGLQLPAQGDLRHSPGALQRPDAHARLERLRAGLEGPGGHAALEDYRAGGRLRVHLRRGLADLLRARDGLKPASAAAEGEARLRDAGGHPHLHAVRPGGHVPPDRSGGGVPHLLRPRAGRLVHVQALALLDRLHDGRIHHPVARGPLRDRVRRAHGPRRHHRVVLQLHRLQHRRLRQAPVLRVLPHVVGRHRVPRGGRRRGRGPHRGGTQRHARGQGGLAAPPPARLGRPDGRRPPGLPHPRQHAGRRLRLHARLRQRRRVDAPRGASSAAPRPPRPLASALSINSPFLS
mmetsp:Transcript_618/g.1674  ORF Transcript_618/g.1674 Transcript_618/m.1674 type:complete len:535 (-) Transcript_618:9-1613(-)